MCRNCGRSPVSPRGEYWFGFTFVWDVPKTALLKHSHEFFVITFRCFPPRSGNLVLQSTSRQALECGRLQRLAEKVALYPVAVIAPEIIDLLPALDPFCGRFETEAVAQGNDGLGNRFRTAAVADAIDERPIDLDPVDGEIFRETALG